MTRKKHKPFRVWVTRDAAGKKHYQPSFMAPDGKTDGKWTYPVMPTEEWRNKLDAAMKAAGIVLRPGGGPIECVLMVKGKT